MADMKDLITPVFRTHTQMNEAKTKTEGRPIYDELEVVELHFAGDGKKMSVFPAHEIEPNATRTSGQETTYAMLYNKQYQQFKEQVTQTVAGTPLSEAPFLTEGKRRELKACKVFTVEALAALDGPQLKMLGMFGREMKNQSIAYLEKAKGSADVTGLASQVALLQEQLKAQAADFDARMREMSLGGRAPTSEEARAYEEAPRAEAEGKPIEECTVDELKDFILRETGKRPLGNPSHATLVDRAMEIATGGKVAA